MRAITSTLYVCLLVLCVPVIASESDAGTEPTNIEGGQGVSNGQHEDILDRDFSPLDNAVSDINRDLNQGDGNTPPDSSD